MPFKEPSIRDLLETRVPVRPLTRVLLAVCVIAGGLAFATLGAILFFVRPATPYPHPLGVAALSLLVLALGAGFVWVGLRLTRKGATSENLLSPSARRRASLIVGCLAAGMLALAYESRSVPILATAVGLVVVSYWLFPVEGR